MTGKRLYQEVWASA
jgi:hypothetical protein